MQEIQEDYYQILGVEEQASPEDIRKAYLKLAKKLHPDRFPNDPEKRAQAQVEFSRVTRAHEVLGDPKQREEYDAIRILSRNRAALESGTPGSASAPAASAPAAGTPGGASSSPHLDGKPESKESWANKHFARAQESFTKKRYQDAETAIKEAIRLMPNKAQYHAMLGQIYMARGWKTLAQTEVQTALRIDPQDPEAKSLELKLKAATKQAKDDKKPAGLLDQLKQLLSKKM